MPGDASPTSWVLCGDLWVWLPLETTSQFAPEHMNGTQKGSRRKASNKINFQQIYVSFKIEEIMVSMMMYNE